MPRQRVPRSRLPFQILNEFEATATEEFNRLLGVGMELIALEVMNDTGEPGEEDAIAGTNAPGNGQAVESNEDNPLAEPVFLFQSGESGALRKTLNDKREDQWNQRLRDLSRREEFGAPTLPGRHFAEETITRLLTLLPFQGGRIRLDDARAKYPRDGMESISDKSWKEETVPLFAVLVLPDLDAGQLRAVLRGEKKETVRAVRHPGIKEYTIVEGGATVFAAILAFVPALEILTIKPRETDSPAMRVERTEDILEIETEGRLITREHAYRLPSYLEPIAEIAREFTLPDFLLLQLGQKSEEEREVVEKALQKDGDRAKVWIKLYNEQRLKGVEIVAAERAVRKDSRWLRAENVAELARELKVRVEEKWEDRRNQFFAAVLQFTNLREIDQVEISLEDLDLTKIYHEAQKGKEDPGEEFVQETFFRTVYQVGQLVEIRDLKGLWRAGEIKRVDDFSVRVRRNDGSMRTVSDVSGIRTLEKERDILGLDISDQDGIIEEMNEIRIPKFDVFLPLGSNSLKVERQLEPVTEEMNRTPLRVNKQTWAGNLATATKELERLTGEAKAEANDQAFRPNSPADCARIFFEERDLPVQRVNKKSGLPSCDKETLQALHSMGDKLAGTVIEAREAQSKVSQLTKWEPFAKAGEVQCNWLQLGTPHGRYACEKPNLQNRIVEIRETIEPPDGFKLVSFDQGQAEYVVFASLSKDPTLVAAFESDQDFHLQMWNEVKEAVPNVDLHEPDDRKSGKTINFAILYMMQPFTLGKKLGIASDEATKLINAWKSRAPVAVQYMENYIKHAQRSGSTATYFGRTREMPELKTARGGRLHELTKTAWHHHNAGTAAEIFKIQQVRMWKAIRRQWDFEDVRIGLQMHDELILIVRNELVSEVEKLGLEVFKREVKNFLLFEIDRRTGSNWRQISK